MPAVSLTVNGKAVTADVDPRTLLVQFLREHLRLTGTHVGCDTSQCGACVVHVNGIAVKSCTMLALQADGANVLDHRRRRAAGRPAASDAGGFPREPRPAVRLLHARHDDVGDRHGAPQGQRPRRAHHPPGARRQSVPLHRLPQHRQGDRGGRQSHEGHDTGRRNRLRACGTESGNDLCTNSNIIARRRFGRRPTCWPRVAEAKLLAGGHSLIPAMKLRLAQAVGPHRHRRIEACRGIELEGPLGRHRRHDRHADVANSPMVKEAHPGAGRARRARSATRRCATAAPSAARSPTTIRTPTIRRRCLGLAPPSSPTSAASLRTISSTACSRPRSSRTRSSPRCSFPMPKKAAYEKFKHPASGFALVGVFVSSAAPTFASR